MTPHKDPPNIWTAVYRVIMMCLAIYLAWLHLEGDRDREEIKRDIATVVANGGG